MQRLVSIPEAIAVVLYREHVQAYQHHEDKIFRRAVEFKTNHASGLGKGSPLANPEHEVVASIIAKFFQGIDTQELEEIWKQALEIVRSWDHFAGLRDWMEYYDAEIGRASCRER